MYDIGSTRTRDLDPGFLERFRRRDPEALGTVFDLFAPDVDAFLARFETSPTRRTQLVDAVFRELWASADQLGGGENEIHQLLLQAVGSCLGGRTLPVRTPGDN